jgi:F0F1-type ATP synthase gamma subunit
MHSGDELVNITYNADKLIKDLRLELDRERENSFT